MNSREDRDRRILAVIEEITQKFRNCKEKYDLQEENDPAVLRLKALAEKLTTERRLIEEVSLPCRFILEHVTTFMGKADHTVGFSLGQQLELGRGSINDFSIQEWGNVCLVIGNVHLCWRDQDYQYLFYPDKVILRSVDRSKPEIHLFFNFAFKYSKILDEYSDVPTDKQTLYCYPDLFESKN